GPRPRASAPPARTEPEGHRRRREARSARERISCRGRPQWVGRDSRCGGVTMSTTTSPASGRARKSLEYQLDRFDSILDGLADALDESVADAVKDAVGQAVREAVGAVAAELVANPAVAGALAAAHGLTPPPSAEPAAAPGGPTWR